ncbi:MAG TPA: hypothetical protein VEJ18_14200, partial [Planctomycetota bacterium]|nr:hypothetical protein [Planctomycetota bacterium]
VKDAGAFVKLWSENDAAQQEALAALGEAEVRHAPGRLRDLARIGSPAVRALAQARVDKLGDVRDPKPLVRRVIADIHGFARFARVPAPATLHLFATRPTSPDVHRPDVRVEANETRQVDARPDPPRPADPAVKPQEDARNGGAQVLRVTTDDGRVLAEIPMRTGETTELAVGPQKLRLEVVDRAADAGRLGEVRLVHRLYGVFVKLDPGFSASPGEEIVIVREGREVARSRIVRVAAADETYPAGALQVEREAEVKKGDEVRRAGK